jgi:hypothetical protein
MPTVPYISFFVFNIAIPNLIAVLAIIVVFIIAIWARIPKIF